MATYIYETIPSKKSGKPKRFEIRQSMNDKPLTKHPETGEPIRRVITGGYGLMLHATTTNVSSAGSCCSHGGCCCHKK